MDSELAGANGLRADEGTALLRQCNMTYNYDIYLFLKDLFGLEHSTFVLVLIIYLYLFYLFLFVLVLFIYLGSPSKSHS